MTATVRNTSIIQRLYNWTMEKSAHPHAEFWLALVSFVEASFFPIPPHPLLGLMCLANPKKAVRYAIICTLASVAGGMLGYSIGYFLYESIFLGYGLAAAGSIGGNAIQAVAGVILASALYAVLSKVPQIKKAAA